MARNSTYPRRAPTLTGGWKISAATSFEAIRTDNVNQYLDSFPKSKGIDHQISAPYTPEQNGAAELLNCQRGKRIG
jgi:hypothetical protein